MGNTVINTPELLNLDSTTGATILAKGTVNERPLQLLNVDYLVVAGGGGGGGTTSDAPGGGGAGGLITSYGNNSGGGASPGSALSLLISTNYTVTVGQGGNGGAGRNPGTDGANSVFNTITSTGGGGGGTSEGTVAEDTGRTGGSAGGSGTGSSSTARPSTPAVSNPVQGYAGGASITSSGKRGGGGGGAGESGNTDGQGYGGDGLEVSITGSAVFYAGGGGGGYFGSTSSVPGGSGGGGDCPSGSNGNGGDGTDNTGGGGGAAKRSSGGGSRNGGNGGDGVVILRYPNNYTINVGAGLTYSTTPDGLDKVTTFTQGTGTITFSGATVTNQNNAIDGTLRFNTETNKTEYFDGAGWYEIVDEYASGFIGPATNYFDTKLYTGNGSRQSIGGYIKGAASFNGSSSKITLPTGSPFNDSNTIKAVSAWVKANTSTSRVYAFSISSTSNANDYFFIGYMGDLNAIYAAVRDGSSSNQNQRYANITSDTNWNHIVAQLNGSTVEIWMNGVQLTVVDNISGTATSSSWISYPSYSGTVQGAIGLLRLATPQYSSGSIDQVRVYDTALNSTDIMALYEETAATANTAAFPSGQTAIATYTMDTSANGLLNTQDLNTVDYPSGAGCLALYEMNGNSNDTSGTYNGTPTNITYEGGAFDQAAVFNGSSSKITLPSFGNTFENNFSYSLWFTLDSSPSGGISNLVATQGDYYNYAIIRDSDKKVETRFEYPGGGSDVLKSTSTFTDYGTWHHLTITKSSTNGAAIYIDGTLEASDATATSNLSPMSSGNTLGVYGNGSQYWLDGKIDQVRIFNTALTQSQVTTLARGIATSYSGTATNVNFNGHLDFQPDLVWIKNRDQSDGHRIQDSVRGTKYLESNSTGAQIEAGTAGLTTFDSNGFSIGSGNSYNTNNEDYVSWNWKAGGAAVTNNDGTIASQVSANKDSGFSIVKWTGDATSNPTVGHGLNQEPDLYIVKELDNGTVSWLVGGNSTLFPETATSASFLRLNTTDDIDQTGINTFGNSGDNLIKVGARTNNGEDSIAYCFHSVSGYSKIGSYTGTGTTSGNFVETGFEPSFVMVKRTDGGVQNWVIFDNKRSTTNPRNKKLAANLSSEENNSGTIGTDAQDNLDFSATGFRAVTSNNHTNILNGTYLYMAFA